MSNAQFFDLTIPAPRRLAMMREAFALRHHPAGGMQEARDAIEALREAREAHADATRAYERG